MTILPPNFRTRQTPEGWVLEVARPVWTGSHTPETCWSVVRRWKREPDEARIRRAMDYAMSRYFRKYTNCGAVLVKGFMFGDICQICAETTLGVRF